MSAGGRDAGQQAEVVGLSATAGHHKGACLEDEADVWCAGRRRPDALLEQLPRRVVLLLAVLHAAPGLPHVQVVGVHLRSTGTRSTACELATKLRL